MNPHARRLLGPGTWLLGLVQHRSLLALMVRRDIAQRYRGSWLGWTWQFLQPALMLVVYTFLFAGVFGARWPGAQGGALQFGLVLYAGLLVHGAFADLVNRAPGLVVSHANYVKKVIFPLDILPVMALGTALFQALIGFGVLVGGLALVGAPLHGALAAVPLLLATLMLFALGLAYVLASLGTFVRDIGQAVTLATTALLFLSPVFYPVSAVPEPLQAWLQLNPLAYFIETVRAAVVQGAWPAPGPLLAWLLAGAGAAWAGHAWFELTRAGFADVL